MSLEQEINAIQNQVIDNEKIKPHVMIPLPTTKNPMAHSHSRLTVFSACPLAYKLQYIDKVPTEDSDAMEIGAAAHEFFEAWVKEMPWIEKNHPVGVPDDYLPRKIEELAAKCFQKSPRNQDNFKDYMEICRTFAAAYKPDPAYPDVECERQVAFDRHWKVCDWFSKEVMFRAKLDLLELPGSIAKKIRITDYKTGFSGAMNSFQLDVYALVAKMIFPQLEQVEICFYYVKSGFKQTKLLDVADLDITKVQLEALMQRVESESRWKAKPGSKCLSCPVAASCTAKPSDLVRIDGKASAEVLASEIAFLEAQAKAKKKALNAWCRKEGPVETGGLVWNHYPQESLVVDMGPFLSALVSYSIDPAKVLNPDSKAIKKAMKDTPGFQEAITPYIGVDVSTRFYAKKADGEDD